MRRIRGEDTFASRVRLCDPRRTAPMNEDAFLAALHDNPNDEVTWLAVADWLEETDQPQRAELVRLTRSLRANRLFSRGLSHVSFP